MSEAEKTIYDILKFVASIIIILLIFYTVFGGSGIMSNTFNFMMYMEPIIIQDYLSSSLSVASYAPGDFSVNIRTTGSAQTIKLYKDQYQYISIKPVQDPLIKTEFASIDPNPILINCTIDDVTITLQKDLAKILEVKKSDNICEVIA